MRGFAQAAVKPNIQVLPEAQGANGAHRPVAIRFEIGEGPQTVVSGVTFGGNTTISSTELQTQMALQTGKPFYRPQLAVDRDAIERAYRSQGFQGVSVISQLTFANEQQQVALAWTIREGDQVRIDHVLITGNSRISTNLIRRELTFRSGDPMSDEAMLESQRQLAALGLFRRVRISELPRTGSLARDVPSKSRRLRRPPSITAAASKSAASPNRPMTAAARSISWTSARADFSRSAAGTCGARIDR